MRSSWMIVAAMAGAVSAEAFGDLAACGQNCINNLRQSVACVPVTDQCLCGKPEFLDGIRDCVAAACSKPDANAAISYATSFCSAASAPASSVQPATTSNAPVVSTTSSPKPETTSSPAPTTTPSTTVAVAPTTSSTPVSSSSSASSSKSSSIPSSTTSATLTPATQSTLVPTTASALKSSSSSILSTSTSSTAASASETAAVAADDSSSANSGLSQAARIGVGVGATAAGFVVLAFLAICLVRRRRGGGSNGSISHGEKPSRAGMIKISDPLPGSGRTYAGDRHNAKYIMGSRRSRGDVNELENYSRRYEDLLPRRDPHPMV